MSVVETITGPAPGQIFTARSFLEYMRKSSPQWWTEDSNPNYCDWVFRGQWDENWELVPSAARHGNQLNSSFYKTVEDVLKDMSTRSAEWSGLSKNIRNQFAREWAQLKHVVDFINLARSLSLVDFDPPDLSFQDLPVFVSRWVEDANVIESKFGSSPLWSGYLKKDDPSIALAQHHKIPTFLLDWTEDPLAACYFATNHPKSGSIQRGAAVWCLNIKEVRIDREITSYVSNHILDEMDVIKIGVLSPAKKGNSYLSSQSGILTYFEYPNKLWDKLGRFPPLEYVLKNTSIDRFNEVCESTQFEKIAQSDMSLRNEFIQKSRKYLAKPRTLLRKVILPVAEIPELKTLLLREGVSKAHMMPSLDNVALVSMNAIKR